jgi:hypothetical protein
MKYLCSSGYYIMTNFVGYRDHLELLKVWHVDGYDELGFVAAKE